LSTPFYKTLVANQGDVKCSNLRSEPYFINKNKLFLSFPCMCVSVGLSPTQLPTKRLILMNFDMIVMLRHHPQVYEILLRIFISYKKFFNLIWDKRMTIYGKMERMGRLQVWHFLWYHPGMGLGRTQI